MVKEFRDVTAETNGQNERNSELDDVTSHSIA